jgi:RimJ/RimL family protein N-acetyltransferase
MSSDGHGDESAHACAHTLPTSQSEPVRASSPYYFLTTGRLGFRCWNARDEGLAIDLWCDPLATALIGGPWTREAALDRLAREIEQQDRNGVQYWPIFLLANGRHVGCAGLRPYESRQSILEMGVHLLPEFWRQGLAREACAAIIVHAFDTLGAVTIFAGHHPQNAASGRLLVNLGFSRQGEQLYAPTGLMHPSYLLRREQAASR